MVRSQSCLENGHIKNIKIMGGFYIPYFNPTIDFNMPQYTYKQQWFIYEYLQAGLLLDFNDFIISDRSKHTMHAMLQDD